MSRRTVMGAHAILQVLSDLHERYDVEPRLMGLAAAEGSNLAFAHYVLRMRPRPRVNRAHSGTTSSIDAITAGAVAVGGADAAAAAAIAAMK